MSTERDASVPEVRDGVPGGAGWPGGPGRAGEYSAGRSAAFGGVRRSALAARRRDRSLVIARAKRGEGSVISRTGKGESSAGTGCSGLAHCM